MQNFSFMTVHLKKNRLQNGGHFVHEEIHNGPAIIFNLSADENTPTIIVRANYVVSFVGWNSVDIAISR